MRYQITLWIVGVIFILFPSFAFPPALDTVLHIVLGALVVVVGVVIHSERALRGYLSLAKNFKEEIITSNKVNKNNEAKSNQKQDAKTTEELVKKQKNKIVSGGYFAGKKTTQDVATGIRSLIAENTKIEKKVARSEPPKQELKQRGTQKKETQLDTVPHPGLAASKKPTNKELVKKETQQKEGDNSDPKRTPHAATLRNRSWVVGKED